MKLKAVLFDIDGTLYPIKYLNRQFFKLSLLTPLKSRNFFKARKLVRRNMLSRPEERLTREEFLVEQAKSVKKNVKYFDRVYRILQNKRRLIPYKHVKETLAELKNMGLILGVLSDFPVENKLKELGVEEYFDMTLSAENCAFLKPDRRAFEYILSEMNLNREECLYVGDSKRKDYDGAMNAGMRAELIGFTFNNYKELLKKIKDELESQ